MHRRPGRARLLRHYPNGGKGQAEWLVSVGGDITVEGSPHNSAADADETSPLTCFAGTSGDNVMILLVRFHSRRPFFGQRPQLAHGGLLR